MEGQQAFSEGTVRCVALNKPFFELEWRLAVLPLIGKIADMAFVLAEEQIEFIQRMIRRGRYNSQSEVVRAALRRLQEDELDYLRPPVLTSAEIQRIYGADREEDARERSFGKSAFDAVRRRAKKRRGA